MIGRKFLAREVTSAISSTSLPLLELTKPVQKSFHRAQSTINKQQSKDDGQSSNCSTELSLSFPELRVGQGSPMTVLHVESPREIYLCNNERELAKLHEHIFNIASSINPNPLFIPTNGSLVLARSEGNWYRALVEKVEGISVKIFCPDFGFRDTISLDMVRKVNKRINSIQQRFLACRCILVDWVEQTDFSEREIRNLRKLLPVSAIKVKVAVLEKIPLGYVVQIDGVDKRTVSGHKKDSLEEIARLRMEE